MNFVFVFFIDRMAAASPQPMILRVVDPDHARKLELSSRPASVDALMKIIKEQLKIDLDFELLYEDPDFDGKLTSLLTVRNCHKKLLCTYLFHTTQVMLIQQLYSQMCHLQSASAGGLQAPFQSQHLHLMLN